MLRRKTYLVTGARGFLGTALSARLRAEGHIVRAGVSAAPIRDCEVACPLTASVSEWQSAIEGCDGVFHLAWSTVPGSANKAPLSDLETNLLGTVRLLEAIRQQPNTKILFASSGGAVYGTPTRIPIDEDHSRSPLGAYGAAKLAAETYLDVYRRQWQVDARIMRLSNPYGPGQNINGNQGAATIFAARAVKQQTIDIWGEGDIVRDYLYIDDAIDAFSRFMNTDAAVFENAMPVLNVGSGKGISLNEIILTIERILKRKIKVQYSPSRGFDVDVNVLDVTHAYHLIGWRPKIGFAQGMAQCLAYLKESLSVTPQ
ncbi:NAD-dependent epimerase/dehydratase family protein [Paraburkholderia phytofirmans]|uniref:NAD-dependent epimerase/dehydratase n=1 Tax=Paraburkholderia phytofirmans (strain DSM 17436 / LMG 22146 / PsJN) TaxID=398527 RepID=B2T9A6_PARPJ|nr:NAD-dependent epimerase/dehydratase family protein [Paraburkholderia phytofirmans]ACD21008.1 NAD-dependent epimerase/dehydratase [Paraburkholderia phytofirmans PsJN]